MKENQDELSTKTLRGILARDDAESLRAALDNGLDPKAWLDADPYETILAVAILKGSVKCVELLLERDGDWTIDAPFDEDLDPPLGIALERGSDEILKTFIEKRVVEKYSKEWLQEAVKSLGDREEYGEPAIAFLETVFLRPEATSELLSTPSLVKFLRKKAAVHSKSSASSTLAARWSTMARRLLDAENQSKLILIEIEELAADGHKSRIKKLLKRLSPELRREGAGRALVYATGLEDWDFAEQLLAMGADCTARNTGGWTALMYASRKGNLGLVRKLLAGGADLHACNEGTDGENAVQMARSPMIRRYLEKLAARDGK